VKRTVRQSPASNVLLVVVAIAFATTGMSTPAEGDNGSAVAKASLHSQGDCEQTFKFWQNRLSQLSTLVAQLQSVQAANNAPGMALAIDLAADRLAAAKIQAAADIAEACGG
jgi:hypothetical protein